MLKEGLYKWGFIKTGDLCYEEVSMASRSDRAQLSFIFVTSLNFVVLLMKYLRATSAEVLTQQFYFNIWELMIYFYSKKYSI